MLPLIEDLEHYCIFLDFNGTLVEIQFTQTTSGSTHQHCDLSKDCAAKWGALSR